MCVLRVACVPFAFACARRRVSARARGAQTTDLSSASPALAGHCGVVALPGDCVPPVALVRCLLAGGGVLGGWVWVSVCVCVHACNAYAWAPQVSEWVERQRQAALFSVEWPELESILKWYSQTAAAASCTSHTLICADTSTPTFHTFITHTLTHKFTHVTPGPRLVPRALATANLEPSSASASAVHACLAAVVGLLVDACNAAPPPSATAATTSAGGEEGGEGRGRTSRPNERETGAEQKTDTDTDTRHEEHALRVGR